MAAFCIGDEYSEKWGFIDSSLTYVIEPKYDQVKDFYNGLAAFKSSWNWGYIDMDGSNKIPPKFDSAGDFISDYAIIGVRDGNEDKFTIINKLGKILKEPLFNTIAQIECDSINKATNWLVNYKGEWFSMNKNGELTLPIASASAADHPFLVLHKFPNGLYGFLSSNGELISDPKYSSVRYSPYGLFPAATKDPYQNESRWGYLNQDLRFVVQPKYQSASEFKDGFAIIQSKYNYGLIDSTGKIIIIPQYKNLKYLGSGRLSYGVQGLWGLMDCKGDIISEPIFSSIGVFSQGLAWFNTVNKGYTDKTECGFIDLNGIEVFRDSFIKNQSEVKLSDGLAIVPTEIDAIKGIKYAYINQDGIVKIPLHWSEVGRPFSDGLAAFYATYYRYDKNGLMQEGVGAFKWGYQDKNGNIIIQPRFEYASPFANGKAIVSEDGNWFFIDREGQRVGQN